MQKKPLGQRLHEKNLSMIGGVPWKMSAKDDEADGEEMKGDVIRPEGSMEEPEKEMLREVLKQAPPKSFRTQKKDYEEHVYSRSCVGCKALRTGSAWLQRNSEACRKRMEGEMKDLEKAKNAKRRREDFVGKPTGSSRRGKRDDETKTEEEPDEKKRNRPEVQGRRRNRYEDR